MRRVATATAACLLAANMAGTPAVGAAPAQPATAAKPGDLVTLNFMNAELDAVVRAIGQFTGKTFLVDPRVKGTLNLISEKPVTRDIAYHTLLSALRLQGYAVVESDGLLKVVPEADAKLQGGAIQAGNAPSGRGDQLVTQVFRLNYESANNMVAVLRPLIAPNNTINASPGSNALVITDYAENLKRIGRIIAAVDTPSGSDLEVVMVRHAIASDLAAMVSRLLESAPAAQGAAGDTTQKLTIIAEPRTNALLIRSGSAARTALAKSLIERLDQPTNRPGNMQVVYLKNADAVKLAQTLRSVISADASLAPAAAAPAAGASAAAATTTSGVGAAAGMIQADPATNTLIITAPEPVYRNLRAIIDKLDVRRAQVFVESLIVEVTADNASEFGIQWLGGLQNVTSGTVNAVGGTNFGTTGQNIVTAAQNLGSLGVGLNIGVVKGTITVPGIGQITNLGLLARALESKGNTNILSTPNLLTLDNEEAKIVIGQNVPFVTGQYTNTSSSSTAGTTTVNPFQTITRQDVGLTLKVKPQISEGGTVKMAIFQEVSSVQDTTNAAGIITNKRSIESNVLVDDGQIIVIGGLVQDSVQGSVQQVPGLGSVPVIGSLFRYDTRKRTKTNLMVFLRPYVIRDGERASSFVLDRYDYMRGEQAGARPESVLMLPDMPAPQLPPLVEGLDKAIPKEPGTRERR